MSAPTPHTAHDQRDSGAPNASFRSPVLDIVIPVYNEDAQLAASVTTLRRYLDESFPYPTVITVADNASTDNTWPIAEGLARSLPGVRAVHLDQKGRGRALRTAWSSSIAEVVAYMDVDLATGLDALFPLVAPLVSGFGDVAIGTRLAPGSHVVRGTRREFISRGYNQLVRVALRSQTTDAQCGFKAVRRDAAARLLPHIEDNAWFFDTELLVTARRLGMRIHEVPVSWVDDLDSRVKVISTARDDLKGVVRMMGPQARRRTSRANPDTHPVHASPNGAPTLSVAPFAIRSTSSSSPSTQVFTDELLRFAGIGAVSTATYVLAFGGFQLVLPVYLANSLAIIGCSLGNTAAHRGMAGTSTHGLHRPTRLLVAGGLLVVSLGFTTGALAAIRAIGLRGLGPELAAVTVANVVASVLRFAILRTWVFRPAFGTQLAQGVHDVDPQEPVTTPVGAPASRSFYQPETGTPA